MTLSRSSLDPPLREQDADVYHSVPLRMVVEKPPMLSEVTTQLVHMVERWTAWTSKAGKRAGGVQYVYLDVIG